MIASWIWGSTVSLAEGGPRTTRPTTNESELAVIDDHDLPDGWLTRIEQMIIEDDVHAIAAPWILICTHLRTGCTTFTGPSPDGLSVLEAAEWELREQRRTKSSDLSFEVARLVDPSALGAVSEPSPPPEPGAPTW